MDEGKCEDIEGHGPPSCHLALPLGELSPKVTERVLALPLGELSPKVTERALLLPLPLGEVAERSEDGEGRAGEPSPKFNKRCPTPK